MTNKRSDLVLVAASTALLMAGWAVIGFVLAAEIGTNRLLIEILRAAPVVAVFSGGTIVLFELLHKSLGGILGLSHKMLRNLWVASVLYSLGFGGLIGISF